MRFLVLALLILTGAAPATRPIDKFVKPTDEQNAKAIDRAKRLADDVEKSLDIELTDLETAHFLIFTDWEVREHAFLKTASESAYAAVAKQFELSPKDNVFVGKVSIYMFAGKEAFRKYAREYDQYPAGDDLIGYYSPHDDGSGHLAMYKPEIDPQRQNQPRQQWAYVMTRELSRAFVSRYRTDANLPVWLEEGIAESIAQSLFPSATIRYQARLFAQAGDAMENIFEAEARPTKAFDSAVWSMTQFLLTDRKKFIRYVDAIKDGEDPQNSLQGIYGFDFPGFLKAWRVYALSN
jgi:hypothetical protein